MIAGSSSTSKMRGLDDMAHLSLSNSVGDHGAAMGCTTEEGYAVEGSMEVA